MNHDYDLRLASVYGLFIKFSKLEYNYFLIKADDFCTQSNLIEDIGLTLYD